MRPAHPERRTEGPESNEQKIPRTAIVRASLALAALTLLRALWSALTGLAPQEAYYWQYARHPALSYLDHPPMAAWWIGAGTRLFGTNPFGIRFFALLSGAALTVVLYRLGARLFSPRAGLFAAAIANATVLFQIGATMITPDVPLLLFWSAACLVLCELLLDDGHGGAGRWYVLGLCVGLALLSKYTAALLFPEVLLACALTPRGRGWLKTPHPYLAALLALACFTPVIVWNAQHQWVSFAFQTSGRMHTVRGFQPVLIARFLGLQLAALGPLGFLLTWAPPFTLSSSKGQQVGGTRPEPSDATRDEVRGHSGPSTPVLRTYALAERVVLSVSLPALALFCAVSPFHWVKMNWPAPAYVGLWVAAGALADRSTRWRLLAKLSIATGALLALAGALLPHVPAIPFHDRDDLISGWQQLADHLSQQHADAFVGADYKTASELAVDLPGRPQTASAELFDDDGLMYSTWSLPQAFAGKTLLVASDRRAPLRDARARLARHCGQLETLPPFLARRGAKPVTTFDLWRCVDYRAR
jgi:4-amino-4-deoxy-L-arabinose transferase-like glycosyltransferase